MMTLYNLLIWTITDYKGVLISGIVLHVQYYALCSSDSLVPRPYPQAFQHCTLRGAWG